MRRRSPRHVGLTARRSPLGLEALEDRTAPSAVVWTLGADGDFANAAGWTDQVDGSHHVPGPTDDADANGFALTSSADQVVNSITNTPSFQITGGTFAIEGATTASEFGGLSVAAGATLSINSGGAATRIAGGGTVAGAVTVANGATLEFASAGALVDVEPGATFSGSGLVELTGGGLSIDTDISVADFNLSGGRLLGGGTLTVTGGGVWDGGSMEGSGTTAIAAGANVSIFGSIQLNRTLANGGSILQDAAVGGNGLLTNLASGSYTLNDANFGPGVDNAGTFTSTGPSSPGNQIGGSFTNSGTLEVEVGALSVQGDLVQTAGLTDVSSLGTLVSGTVELTGGVLSGDGRVDGNVTGGGTIQAGGLHINGDLDLSGTLEMDLSTALMVSGTVTLSGSLQLTSNFIVPIGFQNVFLSSGGSGPINGTFAGLPGGGTISAGGQDFKISYTGGDGNDVSLTAITGPPTSNVLPLPHEAPRTFSVSWFGDDPGGPGIAFFNVYVSDNGGPFTPFVTHTAPTSAVFTGVKGHSYGFYSVATDVDGFAQPTPSAAQATTFVTADANHGVHAVGAGPGGGPQVKVYNADGSLLASFDAYAKDFLGGVSVAVADVNGDGVPDIITGAGPGGGPHVKVFDGTSLTTGPLKLLYSFYAYAPNFHGGVHVAAGDVTEDGDADIITGAGPGSPPRVKVFSGANGSLVANFYVYAPGFTGGVNVAAGYVDSDGHADIVTGAGPGGGPQVKVFDGAALTAGGSAAVAAVHTPMRSFYAFARTFTGGVTVAAGDVNNDGQDDIIVGVGPGGGPQVKVFSATDLSTIASFYAYAPKFAGGVEVAAAEVNFDGHTDVVTGAGFGGGPQVKVFNGADLALIENSYAFNPAFLGGVFVG